MNESLEAADTLFRSLDREVWVVTAGKAGSGSRGGLLATWVMQASLSPHRPVLLLGIAPNHHTATVIDRDGAAAAHLLRSDQCALGLSFADGSGRDRDKFASLGDPALLADGSCEWAPVLAACYGWMAGPVVARLDAGDRVFYWIEVRQSVCLGGDGPLRQNQLLAHAPSDQRERLIADRMSDTEIQAPLREAWLERVRTGASQLRSR